MKKFLLGLFTIFISANCAISADYACVPAYDLSHGASRFMSTVTGSKFLGEQIAEAVMKKSIAKNMHGKMDVQVKSYSVKDLKKGIFKSFDLKGKNIVLDGVHFSNLKMSTLCDFNYVALVNKKPLFKEELPLAFEVVFSQDDINSTMTVPAYKKIINDVNKFGGKAGLFNITSNQVKINDNKFYYVFKVAIPFVKNVQNVVIASDLTVKDGEIDFVNTKLVNDSFSIDLKKVDRIINYINPLAFSLDILENKKADLTVKNVIIKNDKVYSDGYVVIPKDLPKE